MLKYIDSAEGLIGVIAHEIGHLNNYHITKRKQKIKDIKIFDNITNLATITSAILTNSPEILLQSTITNKSNIQNYYYQFYKSQEREADIFAVNRLNEINISPGGLIKFLKYLEKEFYKSGYSSDAFMFSTHPNYEDRLNIISNISDNNNGKVSQIINNKYLFIQAKLFGYTENNIETLKTNLNGEFLDYGEAIFFSKQGKLLDSLKKINKLIINNKNNSFFYETKGDILFNHGYTSEAKKFYDISFSKNKLNIHIKKRLFDIDYSNLDLFDKNKVIDVFNNNNDLIFYYSKDIDFYHKWLYIFQVLDKEDWMLFVDGWMDILNNDIIKAKVKLNEIKKISNDSKLLYNTNKLINKINDA